MTNFTASEFLLAAPTVSEETFSGAFASEGFLTAPSLSQVHPFVPVDANVQSYTTPAVGFVVGQVMAPAASPDIQPPVLANAVLTQTNILSATGVEATVELVSIEMILRIPLFADGIEINAFSLPSVGVNQVSAFTVERLDVFSPLLRAARLLSANTIHFADNIDVPTVSTPADLDETHFLSAGELDGGPHAPETVDLSQRNTLVPAGIRLDNYSTELLTFITVEYNLTPADLTATGATLGSPEVIRKFTPNDLDAPNEFETATVTQHHFLTATPIETTIDIPLVIATQTQPFTTVGLTSQIEIDQTSLSVPSLFVNDFAIGPYSLQRSAFQSNEQPILQEYQFDSFQRFDAFQTFAFLGYAIGILNQTHVLDASIEISVPVFADTAITQVHTIEADETTNTPVLDTATITQNHVLPAPNDIASQIVVPAIEMIQTARLNAVGLTTQEPVLADAVDFSQIHNVVAQLDIAPPVLPNFFLRQDHRLAPAGVIAQVRFDRTSVFAPTIIATYDLFTAISYVFELDQDAESVEFVAPITCETSFRGFNFGLPLGITFQENLIEGVISPFATPGFYYFEILVTIDGVTDKRPYAIRLTSNVNTTIPIVPKIEWRTNAGSLGRLREGDASYFSVAAGSTTNTPVTFALRSGELPPGLTLASNGEIRGVALPVVVESSYTFTVRASTRVSPTTGAPDQIAYEDRTFSLTIDNLFSAPVIYDVFLKPTNQQSFELKNPYRGVIPEDMLFRSTDPSFGIPRSSMIYLLGGVGSLETIRESVEPENIPVVPRTPTSFHEIKRLKVGEHGIARARDVNGNVVYEVLYRLLLDPQATAGGFSFPRGETRIPVIYNDGSDGIKNVFPNSIRNARLDLIQKVGFAVSDPARARSLTSERLPLWMRSRQDVADPNSVLSFVPAIVIAYLRPGTGEQVSRLIAQSASRLPRPGRILNINTYFVKSFPSTNDGAIFLPDAASA